MHIKYETGIFLYKVFCFITFPTLFAITGILCLLTLNPMVILLGLFFLLTAILEPCLAYDLILKHIKDIDRE